MDVSISVLEDKLNKFVIERSILKQQVLDESSKLKELRSLLHNLESTVNLLQYIVEETVKENESKITSLVTLALRETFTDKELTLVLEHKNYRGQPGVVFMLKNEKTGVEDDPFDSFGGGPASLIGLVLQVISIIRQPKMDRILILDEPLLQVSEGYQHEAAMFLHKICQPSPYGLGFKVLAITHQHQSSIFQIANKKYRVLEENHKLALQEER